MRILLDLGLLDFVWKGFRFYFLPQKPVDASVSRSYCLLGIPSDEGQKPLSQEASPGVQSGVVPVLLYLGALIWVG